MKSCSMIKLSSKLLGVAAFAGALGVALAYMAGFAGPYRAVEPLPAGMIDMHCHAAGIGAGGSGCFISPRLRGGLRFGAYLRAFGLSEKEVAAKGDMAIADHVSELAGESKYISKAVLLALDGIVGPDGKLDEARTEIYVPNEFVAAAVARHNNLLFGASVNPYRKDALKRLAWARAHGAVLVKWIPSVMEIDPADVRLKPFYLELVKLGLPLLTHTGDERAFSSSRDELADPERLRLPLSLGVKVIAAHIAATGDYGGETGPARLARLMREYPNLYADISSLTQGNKALYMKDALLRPEFKGRLVYGSDFPMINTALASPWYFLRELNLKQLLRISGTKNPWDKDILLKQQLGMPAAVFAGWPLK